LYIIDDIRNPQYSFRTRTRTAKCGRTSEHTLAVSAPGRADARATKMIFRPRQLACTLLSAVPVLLVAANSADYDQSTQSYFPALKPPASLLVAKIWSDGGQAPISMSSDASIWRAEMILMESLSGILLKHSNSQGIFVEANLDHRVILQDLSQRRAVSYSYLSAPATVWDLVERFRTNFNSEYVHCNINSNPDSLNIARMAAYKYDAVIVDSALEFTAQTHELAKIFEASDKDDNWFYTNWWPQWRIKDLAVEQNNNPALMNDVACLNDYVPATGVPAFFDGSSSSLRNAFLQGMAPDSLLLGWPEFDELTFTVQNSQHNI